MLQIPESSCQAIYLSFLLLDAQIEAKKSTGDFGADVADVAFVVGVFYGGVEELV